MAASYQSVGLSRPNAPDHDAPSFRSYERCKKCCLTIAQDFGIDTVIDALRLYYQNYKLSDAVHFVVDKEKSLGGLIRTIAMELCQIKTATA